MNNPEYQPRVVIVDDELSPDENTPNLSNWHIMLTKYLEVIVGVVIVRIINNPQEAIEFIDELSSEGKDMDPGFDLLIADRHLLESDSLVSITSPEICSGTEVAIHAKNQLGARGVKVITYSAYPDRAHEDAGDAFVHKAEIHKLKAVIELLRTS